MKKVSVLALVLALALFFTGCTNGELKLYNAFLKSQDILSMESNTNISFTLSGEGLSEENQAILTEGAKMINSSKIVMNQKMEQNMDKTIAKAEMNVGLDMAGIKTDMQIWVEADLSKDTPEILEIIKMPQMLMSSLGEEYSNKEYIVYDFNELMDMQENEINYTELMNWSKEIQPKVTDFLKDYTKNFNSDIKMVEYKGSRAIDNEIAHIYELKLNDSSFKNLMRYSVNNFMENEDIVKFMGEYMDMVLSIADVNENEKEEVNKGLEEMKKELPSMKEKFNKFMDEFNDVKILGDEGIVIEYCINKEGYIVSEKGFIDLSIDLESMESKMNELDKVQANETKMTGVVKLKIDFDTKASNINKDIKIEMPKTTQENSLKITDLMNL